MPRYDGTGPLGAGPLTGRGFGGCRPLNGRSNAQTADYCPCPMRFPDASFQDDQVDEQYKELQSEIRTLRDEVKELRSKLN